MSASLVEACAAAAVTVRATATKANRILFMICTPVPHATGMRHLLRMDRQYIARVWVAVGLASSIMAGFGRGPGKGTALPVKRRLPSRTLACAVAVLITAASRLRCHAHSKLRFI